MDRTCKQCGVGYILDQDDLAFYKKISVPEPKFCPKCREIRRWSFRNEHNLYRRECGKCKKQIISMYSQDKAYVIYCKECFNDDTFDPLILGKDFDFKRPFFEQFDELLKATPLVCIMGGTNSVNSDYVSFEVNDKNCYMNIGGQGNEDCYYNDFCFKSNDCMDNYWIFDCELMYGSIDCKKCYNCRYCQNCKNLKDSVLCYNCDSCSNCFGCVNMKGKQYMFFNQQLEKDSYAKKMQEIIDETKFQEAKQQFEFFKLKFPHRFAENYQTENSSGNYLNQCKNVENSFDIEVGHDVRWSQRSDEIKDCMDTSAVSCSELTYEYVGGGWIYNGKFCALCFPQLSNVMYSAFCRNTEDSFGCVSLKKAKYCILNKQYSQEEYEKLVAKIIEHMKETGEYGEFFPCSISPFGYNETVAYTLAPLKKDIVTKFGFKWYEDLPLVSGQNTNKELLSCESCKKNYKITEHESNLYKKLHVHIPKKCPNCRYMERVGARLPGRLYERECMSPGCGAKLKTVYSPSRKEIIYCEKCYLKEVY